MIEYGDLSDEQKTKVLHLGYEWKREHESCVATVLRYATGCFPPTGSDLFKPDRWGAAHWAWFQGAIDSTC